MTKKPPSKRTLSRRKKIASGTTARAVKEWFGKTPDTRAPLQVQLRILARQSGKCAITGHKFRPGDKKRLDHKVPAVDGGENRETNLQWILDVDHKAKTAAEAAERAKVRDKAKAYAGIKAPASRPIQSPGFQMGKQEAKRDTNRLPMPTGPSGLARQFRTIK